MLLQCSSYTPPMLLVSPPYTPMLLLSVSYAPPMLLLCPPYALLLSPELLLRFPPYASSTYACLCAAAARLAFSDIRQRRASNPSRCDPRREPSGQSAHKEQQSHAPLKSRHRRHFRKVRPCAACREQGIEGAYEEGGRV